MVDIGEKSKSIRVEKVECFLNTSLYDVLIRSLIVFVVINRQSTILSPKEIFYLTSLINIRVCTYLTSSTNARQKSASSSWMNMIILIKVKNIKFDLNIWQNFARMSLLHLRSTFMAFFILPLKLNEKPPPSHSEFCWPRIHYRWDFLGRTGVALRRTFALP